MPLLPRITKGNIIYYNNKNTELLMNIKSLSRNEQFLQNIFSRLPNLDSNSKQLIVTNLPLAVIILGSFLLISTAVDLLTSNIFSFFDKNLLINDILFYVSNIVIAVILFSSYQHLKNRGLSGWKSLFLLNLILLMLTIISGLIYGLGTLLIVIIAFYLLFQIKSYYQL